MHKFFAQKRFNQFGYIHLLPLIFAGLGALILGYLFFTKVFAQTVDTTPPSVPSNLKVYGNLGSTKDAGSRDDLTWIASTDNLGVTSYLIYQIVAPNVYDPNPIAEVTTTSYSRNFAVNGYATDYNYYVVAKDGQGNVSPSSNIAHMTGIWGDVLDSSNYRYVRGAKIEVVGGDGGKIMATTNNTGAYLINLSPGDYTVNYSAKGYITQTFLLTVNANQMTARNVFLKKTR